MVNILDKIDIKEREMLKDKAALKQPASDFLVLDRISYNALKYERGLGEEREMEEYHGYIITVVDKYEEYIRFV